jgi:hypothetical protein
MGGDWSHASARLHALGYDDGGEALWGWTLDLMREHEGLIERVKPSLPACFKMSSPSPV